MRNLTVITGPAAGQKVEVEGELVIGREHSDLDIGDPEISRQHAVLRVVDDGIEVEDLGSMNGTFVNGERISGRVTLAESSKLRIGTTEMELEIEVAEPEPIAQPDVTAPRQAIPEPDVTAPRAIPQPDVTAPRAIPQPDVTAPREVAADADKGPDAGEEIPQPDVTAPRQAIPQPDVTAPRESIPQPDVTAPRESIPEPDVTAPRESIPEPDVTAPRQSIPQPDVTAPRESIPQPDVTAPRQAMPQPDVTAPRSVPQPEPADSEPAAAEAGTAVQANERRLSPAAFVVAGILIGAAIVLLVVLLS